MSEMIPVKRCRKIGNILSKLVSNVHFEAFIRNGWDYYVGDR